MVLTQIRPVLAVPQLYASATVDSTGELKITTADNQTIVIERSEWDNDRGRQTRFGEPVIASDRRAVGATATFTDERTDAEEQLPTQLVIVVGNRVHRINTDWIWGWHFVDGSRRVAIHTGGVHAVTMTHYELYDVASGRTLAKVDEPFITDPNDMRKAVHLPAWATDVRSGLR